MTSTATTYHNAASLCPRLQGLPTLQPAHSRSRGPVVKKTFQLGTNQKQFERGPVHKQESDTWSTNATVGGITTATAESPKSARSPRNLPPQNKQEWIKSWLKETYNWSTTATEASDTRSTKATVGSRKHARSPRNPPTQRWTESWLKESDTW